jgi:hypothetical protein
MIQTLIASIIILSLIVFALYKWRFFRVSGLSFKSLILAFAVKFIAGCVLVAVYTFIHKDRTTADVYKFMDDAKVLQEIRKNEPIVFFKLITGLYTDDHEFDDYLYKTGNWYTQDRHWLSFAKINDYNPFNANRFVTKINAVLWIFTGGNMLLHVLIFSFAGFIGLVAYYKLFMNYLTENSRKLLFLLLFFLPGILLWCSAPLKDTLIITFTGVFFYTLFHTNKTIVNKFLICGLMFILTLYCKYYVAIATIPVLFSYLSLKILPQRFSFSVKAIYAPMLFISLSYIILLSRGLIPEVTSFLSDKRMESLKNAAFADASTYIFQLPSKHWFSFFNSFITAPVISLLRPLFLEKGMNLTMIPSILENFLLLFLLINMILNMKKDETTKQLQLIFWYVFALMVIIGFTSPLAGNIVRYKTAFLPAFLGLIIIMTNENKVIYSIFKIKAKMRFH